MSDGKATYQRPEQPVLDGQEAVSEIDPMYVGVCPKCKIAVDAVGDSVGDTQDGAACETTSQKVNCPSTAPLFESFIKFVQDKYTAKEMT